MSHMQAFLDDLARGAYGMTTGDAIKKGICLSCKELAEPKCHTEAGKAEYKTSGYCEECWDDLFKQEETGDERD